MKEDESTFLNQSELLKEQVHADELQELLARLAATDALFGGAVPTIRDVAEATDASPLQIGRILSQMRGPGDVVELKGRMDGFEFRLKQLESKRSGTPPPSNLSRLLKDSGASSFQPLSKTEIEHFEPKFDEQKWSEVKNWFGSESERIGQVGDEVRGKNSTFWVVVGVATLYFLFVFGGQCSRTPTSQYDRQIPFPVERSIR